jgi:hypothetical protein
MMASRFAQVVFRPSSVNGALQIGLGPMPEDLPQLREKPTRLA